MGLEGTTKFVLIFLIFRSMERNGYTFSEVDQKWQST
jgi:hypothetical protein